MSSDFGLDRGLERHVAVPALFERILRFAEGEIGQRDRGLVGKIVNRRETCEQFVETLFEKPLVRIELKFNEAGDFTDVVGLLGAALNFFQRSTLLI